MPDKYLRYLNHNLQNYVRKIGLTELGTNLISSTITTAHYDMVFGFNPLTLLDLTPLTVGVSGSLIEKWEIVLQASRIG